ncbi:MAG TPA: type III-B CRISPR module RAMP protein Cmr1, partial [Candidatus Heimdallarchaeota archaeon]|nr:type III-B CRISPR module RAMP protein Cmr1 [Candidatus Heimdallarchaeota archaeon]
PAFLAGAQQTEDDCDLRPATLRGLLRWWWRTMHVGYMDNNTLKELETAIWGDAKTGGAVRIKVLPVNPLQPQRYSKGAYKQLHDHAGKTRMGLDYFAYGMWAQGPKGRDRFYMPEGAKWRLEIYARKSKWNRANEVKIPAEDVLHQATCALWLLSRFGGIGSRGRKGFGSLADVEVDGISGLDDIRRIAVELRFNLGLRSEFDERLAESPNLYQIIRMNDISAPQIEPFDVLHQLSAIAQGFADDNANKQIKMALGLPRQIYGPRNEPLRLQDPHKHKPPVNLECRKGERFASPVHYHLTRRAEGGLAVRMVAFPSQYLPSYEECRKFLEELQRHLETNLPRQLDSPTPSRPSRRPTYKPSPPLSSPAGSPASLAFGDYVEAILLEEKTKRGGWKAKHEPTSMVGPIQNTEDVPADKKPGDIVELRVQIPKPHDFAFRWPTEQDRERDRQAKQKRTGPDRRGGRPGGWKDRS